MTDSLDCAISMISMLIDKYGKDICQQAWDQCFDSKDIKEQEKCSKKKPAFDYMKVLPKHSSDNKELIEYLSTLYYKIKDKYEKYKDDTKDVLYKKVTDKINDTNSTLFSEMHTLSSTFNMKEKHIIKEWSYILRNNSFKMNGLQQTAYDRNLKILDKHKCFLLTPVWFTKQYKFSLVCSNNHLKLVTGRTLVEDIIALDKNPNKVMPCFSCKK